MTRLEEDKLSMFIAVLAVCDKYTTEVKSLKAFESAVAALKVIVDDVNTHYGTQLSPTSGITMTKEQARQAMQELTMEIKGSLAAYADATDNLLLKPKVDFPVSALDRARDTEVATLCQQIVTEATDNLAALEDYGTVAGDITDLTTAINAYRATLGSPEVKKGEKKAATVSLKDALRGGMGILENQMDQLMPKLRKKFADFGTEYDNQRKIISRSATSKKADEPAPPTPP